MKKTVWILSLNDFPLGVYSSKLAAEAQLLQYELGRQKQLRECGRTYIPHYHIKECVIDAPAEL